MTCNIEEALAELIGGIRSMRRGVQQGRDKPHKSAMLLAVLDLADDGLLPDNRIYFNDELASRFERHLAAIGDQRDWNQPGPPFFHLRSSEFWHHKVKLGKQEAYSSATTSGGGSRWIRDNIEYAYLSEDAFAVVSDLEARRRLRGFLIQGLSKVEKLGLTFHETIPFSRAALAEIMEVSASASAEEPDATRGPTFSDLRADTNLGPNYIKAMRRFGQGMGLLDSNGHLTSFGKALRASDPTMGAASSQWLMHYHMCAPHRPGPEFWAHLASTQLRPGDEVSRQHLAEVIRDFTTRHGDKEHATRSLEAAATSFVNVYSRREALGDLGVLVDGTDGPPRVSEPVEPAATVFAYVLADYWDGMWPGRNTVNLEAVTSEPGGPASLLLLGTGQANRLLRAMQDEGWVQVQRRAAPYTVVRLWEDSAPFLERIYA